MMAVRERVEDLHKLWKEASEVKGVRDVTADFAVRSKQRDVIAACRVRIWLLNWNVEEETYEIDFNIDSNFNKPFFANPIKFVCILQVSNSFIFFENRFFSLQEYDQLAARQKEIEEKLQELESSPPRLEFIPQFSLYSSIFCACTGWNHCKLNHMTCIEMVSR